jgi:Tol biopolymer transport system component
MGTVYDAVDPALGRHVALKILPPDLVAHASGLRRFIQEAKAASSLNHPNLVSIYEVGSEQRGAQLIHFIAMEKVDGSTLRQMLMGNRLSLKRALELVAQIADAVAAAHAAGIIHRDLKPENVMVSPAGYAKVLDFGLAKLRAEGDSDWGANDTTAAIYTEPGAVVGTAGYMSPEQAQGKEADHRTDIFAIGCILYEALTGKRAFRGTSSVDTLHRIIHADPEPLTQSLPDAPAELQRIVGKAMAKDPDERYQSAKDLALDLRALAREAPKRPSALPRSPAVVVAIAAGVILIVAAAVGIMLWWRTAPARGASTPVFQQITSRGNVIDSRISPDGRFVAFAVREEQGQSLWLRQLATGQELELVPRTVGSFWGITFTPDGNALVYGLKTRDEPRGALYRISTLGGRPEHLLAGTDSNVTFSPDGKRMAWYRADFPHPQESALMIANSDGTGERALATRRPPELFVPMFFTHPSWSPDGKLIAASVMRKQNPVFARLLGFDPESGRESVLSNARWSALTSVEWLPDGSGMVAVASRSAASLDVVTVAGTQLWLIPYPSGEPRQIAISPLGFYREPSISADGSKLTAIATEVKVHISRVSLTSNVPPETLSTGRYDGSAGIAALADGRIVFTSSDRGAVVLCIMNSDGSGRRQLTRDPFLNRYPAAIPAGIAYLSTTLTETDVCVVNDDGQNRRVIARRVDQAPIAISPDGKSIVYSLDRRLWEASVDGSRRRPLMQEVASSPSYSPTGERIAFVTGDMEQPEGGRLVVMSAGGEKILWSKPVPRQTADVRWTPDGNALLLLNLDAHNIWMYPLRGEPKQVTHFDDFVWSFAIAPDGKTLIVAQGSLARDAVMITGFR